MRETSRDIDRRRFLAVAAATLGAANAPTLQDAAAQRRGEPTADRWQELFDGESLNGWHVNPKPIGHGDGGRWRIEPGGVLAGEQDPPGSGNGGVLLTDQRFGDFELSVEMKPDWGVCSGLFLRGNDRGQCFQMMVDYHDAGNVGQIYGEGVGGWSTRTFNIQGRYDDRRNLIGLTTGEHRTAEDAGLLLACTPQEWLETWKVNDWNQATVRVEGGVYPLISTKINDRLVGLFDAGVALVPKYDREKVAGLLGPNGSIGVQVHGGDGWPQGAKCRWRNFRLRRLG
ncbi:MAG: DUF1080 domain-containing protein [Planctomycetota bacterium]